MKRKTFKFRLYPTKEQAEIMQGWLKMCRELYNSALRERNDAYRLNKVSVNYYSQSKQLTEIKNARPEFKDVNSHVLQDVLDRLDKSFKAFFKKNTDYPNFKRDKNYKSFSFPSSRYKLEFNSKWDSFIEVSRIGRIKLNKDCEFTGTPKTATIKESCGKWYVCIAVEFEPEQLPKTGKEIGLDVGWRNLLTLSDESVIENQRILAKYTAKLRILHRRVSRRKKGSNGWKEAVIQLKKQYEKTANHRKHVLHLLSTNLVKEYDLIAIEDFNIAKLVKGEKNAKKILDVSWGYLRQMLEYKSDWYGKELKQVDSHFVNPEGVKFDSLHERNSASANEVLRRAKSMN